MGWDEGRNRIKKLAPSTTQTSEDLPKTYIKTKLRLPALDVHEEQRWTKLQVGLEMSYWSPLTPRAPCPWPLSPQGEQAVRVREASIAGTGFLQPPTIGYDSPGATPITGGRWCSGWFSGYTRTYRLRHSLVRRITFFRGIFFEFSHGIAHRVTNGVSDICPNSNVQPGGWYHGRQG